MVHSLCLMVWEPIICERTTGVYRLEIPPRGRGGKRENAKVGKRKTKRVH
jgi:hypothetical protein